MKYQTCKYLFILITLIILSNINMYSQGPIKNYEKEWKQVEVYSNKGLPKSALSEAKKIYELAKKENQDAQTIKSLVYIIGLQNETREENEVFSIREVESEIANSKEPTTSILNSLLADIYWNYYQQNRWKFYNRTNTVDYKKTDIATWSAENFHKKIGELYLLSIKNEKKLQQTKLETFDAIIEKGNVRHLRSTLYDLLAHRALNYFENDERDLNKPAYAFEIDKADAFGPAKEFIKIKFITKDSLSLQYKALLIYQKLIGYHINDPKPDALLDVDIKRITFIKTKSVHPEKDQLYFDALNHIAEQYKKIPAAAQASYLMAMVYKEKADTYDPYGDTTNRYSLIKAKEICEQIIQQKDSSEGKVNCNNLLKLINTSTLEFSVEKVNVPDIPFRSLIKYKNINTLYLKIIKADDDLKNLLTTQYDNRFWSVIADVKSTKNWDVQLPSTNDFQTHSTEINVDPLPAGEYILVASDKNDFSGKKTIIGAQLFYVSNISFVYNDDDYFVLNREDGQPLKRADIQIWEQKYNYQSSKYEKEKGKSFIADVNGFFKLEKTNKPKTGYNNYSYLLDIKYGNDRLFMNDLLYNNYYYNQQPNESKPITSIHFFTDRAIYRPGQTIYFKGIVLNSNPKEKTGGVLENFSTTVFLRDANYKDIDSLKLKTNEYGSFNGKFQLPQTGLNGQFTLYTKKDGGNVGFKVEEYKRPKFYVDYEPVKGTYKVNDTIKVTGIAKAYAGNNINGAMVKYRVVREPRYLYPWLFWRWWQPPTEQMEIAHGESVTDKDGKFIVEFSAIPDLKIDKKFEPVFDYTIYADVTDINGETRSGEKSVSVSYKSLMLIVTVPPRLPADSLKSLSIRTQNMNGEYEPAKIKITITKLNEEKRLIRNRFWDRPDQFIMRKEEYIKLFPHDEYDNETDIKSWSKGKQVFEKTDSTHANGKWVFGDGKFFTGFYIIEIETKDKNGEVVKDVKYIELFNEKSNQILRPDYLWSGIKNLTVEPGEKASIELGTAADNLFVIQQKDMTEINNQNSITNYSFIKLNNQKQTFNIQVTEKDRPGYGVGWMFIKHNRIYQLNETISLPWSNKELNIEYSSFREKTEPGSTEKWKLKITGIKKEKVAAEMLGSMYDASLDQFVLHNWYKPSIWPSYFMRKSWNGSQNFSLIRSNQRYINDQEIKYVIKNYDYINIIENNNIRGLVGKVAGINVEYNRAPAPPEQGDAVDEVVVTAYGKIKTASSDNKLPPTQSGDVKIRTNFNETAFFLPDLRTDSTGAIEFSFTMPESLTRWKFMALAHTKEAAFGTSTKEIVTQKELMVQPNPPRFLRQGDKIDLNTKIVNLSDKEMTGTVSLQLFDATTNEPVDGQFQSVIPNQYFTVAAGQSEVVKFPIEIPYLFNNALMWRIVAKAGNYSDGEENALPVLTNRMLVTETMPLPMRGTGTKNFTFNKLLNSSKSETLQHYALTLEYTSNPAWYAVQALPYLMEYPYDCAEQTWNRYYANSLATHISNSSPRIKEVFDKWKIKDTAALMSNLQKNQELKAVMLEETPWVLQAKNETEQKRNIALLFDMIKMSEQLNSSFEKLKQMQSSNGGFVWFSGGPDDRYMTQYIVTGIGHLKKLNAIAKGQDDKLKSILVSSIPYLDKKIKEDYDNLVKNKSDLKKHVPGYTTIQYLYMRSFFPENKIATASLTAYNYFRNRVQQTWVGQSKYMQGMIALALYRTDDAKTPAAILKSLKETSINNEELGMYWKDQTNGWFWYQAPIETQSLLIEAFQEAGKDTKTVDDLRIWLLKNKQTNNWKTTKATAEACYALLLQGTQWLSNEPVVELKLGNTMIKSTDVGQEAGTGYFKKVIEGNKVIPQMGNISVSISSSDKNVSASWGGIYWQYFEDLDRITTSATPLNLVKKLFVEKNTDRGPVITPVNDGYVLKVGDKIKVRVELRVDRDMEYVHMKDMRASALEPVNVLSNYKYQGGLGYYESTKDASTNFFFSYLRKGTYVFEYSLFVTHTGNFSNGVTTIQCMYAPEFTSHSEGVRINVE